MDIAIKSSESQQLAKEARLHYSNDTQKGLSRKYNTKEPSYYTSENKVITDKNTLERIQSLGIPPAWKKVWINADPRGHLQATGLDDKGRKQYRYHPEWIKISQQHKFDHMLSFSEALPKIRKKINQDIEQSGMPATKVLATVVWLLDKTFIRVGNPEYAKENKHFGLTTFRNKHAEVTGDTIHFEFVGKSGKEHAVDIHHPRVARTIRKLEELPGYELFQYIDAGERHTVTSDLVNDYIQQITGEDITAKYFRTWGGTVLAAVSLNDIGVFTSPTQAKRNISQAVKEVAAHLRNTPTVCRNYYIHPFVPESYTLEKLLPHFLKTKKERLANLSHDEVAVALLLREIT